MPCKIQIKQNITRKVESMTDGAFDMSLGNAKYLALDVNRKFNTKIVEFSRDSIGNIQRAITVPQGLIDVYYNHELGIEIKQDRDTQQARDIQQADAARAGEEYSDDYMFQTKSIFSAVNEIESKLKPVNKTINSMGSEKNIDDVLKKAGLESELRKQFIQLVNNNPSLKSLKVSEVLGTYLREFVKDSDRQYYKAIDEPISNKLEDVLIEYFDKFKIRKEELDNLKEKFGVDSIGVFDVLAKTVYYAKNRNLLTLPEEYGHVFVELLGSISNKKADNPLFKYMFDNIDKWDGYQRVLRDYKDIYVTKEGNMDIYKIKKEAIGQAIGIALVRNYKVQEGDKDFWAKIQGIIDYILDLIKGMDYVSLNTTVDSVAKDILNKNYDKLDRMRKDTSNYNLLTYSETIKNQNKIDGGKALRFMQWFSQKGMLITGSLAYRLQGTTYRPEIDALHDIDNIVPSDVHKVSLNKQDYLTPEQLESSRLYYKYISEGNYREAKKHKLQGNIRLNIDEIVDSVEVLEDFKKQFPDTDFLYSFYNEKANAFYITINAIWSENQELKDRFKSYTGSFNNRLENFTKEELEQIYLFDFFLRPETSDQYKKIEEPEYGLSLAHFNYAFYEKLNMMGRAKDAFDYQMWDYYEDDSILAPDFNDRLVYFQANKAKEEESTEEETVTEESNVMQQKAEMPMSRASKETLDKVMQVIAKMGVKVQGLQEYLKGNPDVKAKGANALADLIQGIIAIAEGKENVATTEEMVHIATAMIEQVDPKIITEMISKISRFKIYQQVLAAYSEDPNYQLPNGKPNIRKIKKEAVDKLIAEVIIRQSEGSTEFPELMEEEARTMVAKMWQTILDWFRGQYKKANIDIFEQTAERIASGNISAAYVNKQEGLDYIYEQNPELSSIGNSDEYSIYINSFINERFPNTKVKDIVYHGTGFADKIERFNSRENRIYFSDNLTASQYANWDEFNRFNYNPESPTKAQVIPAIINLENPVILNNVNFKVTEENTEGDGIVGTNIQDPLGGTETQYVVRDADQVHILGSTQDIESFREFMKTAPQVFKGEGVFLQKNKQYSDAQLAAQKRILEDQDRIEKVEDTTIAVDPLLMDTEEASNYYVLRNPDGTKTKITKRVTDLVKQWYVDRFGKDKKFTEAEKKFNELKRKYGVEFHNLFELVHGRYFEPDGTRKDSVSSRHKIVDPTITRIYSEIENYYVDLIDSFSKDGKNPLVFSEVKVFDPKEQRAGTIDLLIIDDTGKGHIFDWKFMSVAPTQDDVPWFKQGAYNVQLGKYKEMLMKNYGIKEFGNIRAIPILMDFKYDTRKNESTLVIAGIKIGSVDATKIEDMRLVPVSEESESTGVELLDNLISQLNSVLRQVGKTKVTSDEDREFKKERLNILRKAIRAAQTTQDIAPLVNVIKIMRREGDRLVNDWNMVYDKKSATSEDIDNPELSKFAADIREYIAIGEVFKNVDRLIGDLIYNSEMKKEAKTKAQKKEISQRLQDRQYITEEATAIFNSLEDVKKMGGKFANKFMGERNLVRGLLKSETVWKSLSGRFRGATDSPLASIQILTKLVTNSKNRASKDAVGEVEELMSIRELLAKKGGDLRSLIQQIYQKDDKGGLVNKLIRKYQKDFYERVDDNAGENQQSKKWLMNNIDVEAYKKEATEMLKSRIKIIKNNHEDDIDLQEKLIEQERDKWDITSKTFNGWNNYIIKRHPLDKWYTEEYVELEKNQDLHKLYLFIEKMNNKANDMGYIENAAKSTFIPFIRKSMAESLSWDFSLSAITNFGDNFKLRAEDVGYGAINELTKELEHSIPKYYTYDFSVQKDKEGNVITDEKGKTVNDYSDVSEDLFKNMILYINHMNNYKYLSEVEDQLQLVKTIETFKKHLNSNTTGDVIFENGIPQELEGNKENAKIFDDFMRALLYEEKYPLSDGDTPLNISTRNAVKKLINKVARKEVYPIEENPDAKSLTKTLDAANRAFQLKTLGFEPISGLVNWFGNNIQLATQSGIYFKGREIIKNEFKLFGNKFKNDNEREMFIQLINHFMPLKDDPNYEELKKAGISTLTRQNFSDMLMWFMREPEQHMEKTIFLTLLDNTMVVDGKLVNIREFVKNKYKSRYDSAEAYREESPNIEKEISELQESSSLSATKELVDGKVSIPGFDFNNFKEVQRLSALSKRIARNATGGMTKEDINKMNMNVWTKSMMVFKGWIPKLLDTRFGEFRKVSDDFSVVIDDDGLTTGEKYDIGRVRLFGQFLHLNPLLIIKDINDVLSVNEAGLSKIDALYVKYAESYRKQTGEDLEMDRAEFADLIRTNLRNQVKELATLFALIGLGMSLGFFAPDDDEDKATKNRFRWTQKVVDKFTGEISFFYNPAEIEKLLSGNAFPAISLFADAGRFINNLGMEMTGLDWSNHDKTIEEVRKDAQPVKYLAKMLPVTKSLFTYGAIFSEEFAKEFDITIQKDSRR